MNKTIFQKIIDREIPANILYEDNHIIAIEDINPVAPVHALIIPKKCIPTLNDIDSVDIDILGKMFIVAKKLAKEFKIDESGYRTVFNCNDDGGQTVDHIHLHLIGRRKLNWPPG